MGKPINVAVLTIICSSKNNKAAGLAVSFCGATVRPKRGLALEAALRPLCGGLTTESRVFQPLEMSKKFNQRSWLRGRTITFWNRIRSNSRNIGRIIFCSLPTI